MEAIHESEFLELLEKNQNLVHKVCRIYTNDLDSHRDLFQEICIQLWKSYGKFRGEAKFTTWMYRVALNTALTLRRKNAKHQYHTDVSDWVERLAYDPYDPTEAEQIKLMYRAINQLPEVEKALVFLYLEDKNYTEISSLLGITEVNARVKINRIKNKLKKVLNP